MQTRFRSLFGGLIVLVLSVLSLSAWTFFDTFETHKWYDPCWADWFRMGSAVNGTYQGQSCVKLTGPTNKGAQTLSTNFFSPENWSNVARVQMDIYTQMAATGATVKLQLCSQTNASITTEVAKTIPAVNSWQTITWDVAPTASVSKINIIFDSLGANNATFYVDNVKLVLKDNTTQNWDTFDAAPHQWAVAGSTSVWADPVGNGREFVSHNASTSNTNAGAAYLPWSYNGINQFTELQAQGLSLNWTGQTLLRADVRCSDPAVPIKFYFWYAGQWGQETDAKYVTQANTWQTLSWALPSGAKTETIQGFNPRLYVNNSQSTGSFYIDNIQVGTANTNIRVSKSTSTATVIPGGEITYTITYGNAGTDDAANLYITDVIPVNTALSQAASGADSIEYFVGGSWTGTYSSQATKIRWKDAVVPAGSSGLTVSYKVKVK